MNETVAVDESRCAQEPIHTPGTIQPGGVLLVVDGTDLRITHVSDTVGRFVSMLPSALVGKPLSTVLGDEHARRIERAIQTEDLVGYNPMRLDMLLSGRSTPFECVVHRTAAAYIVELEPWQNDRGQSIDFLGFRKPAARLQDAPDVAALIQTAAVEVQALSGFDRVMIYRFDDDWHGEVIGEATSGDDVPVAYLGLHFPATDIPEQARRLYLVNPVRLIEDAAAEQSALVPGLDATGKPIDLSGAILRSVSPVHLEYLCNMGVAASMSFSIVIDGRLWGLIACHHGVPRRASYHIRTACLLLSDILSAQLASRAAIADLRQASAIHETVSAIGSLLRSHADLADGLTAAATLLLGLFGAQGFAAVISGSVRRAGRTPDSDDLIASIAAALWCRAPDGYVTTRCLGELVPTAAFAKETASGALFISLAEDGSEFIVFFRAEQSTLVAWGGDRTRTVTETNGRLHPRTSFATWTETVNGQSISWTTHTMTAAIFVRQLVLERSKSIERDIAAQRLNYLATHDILTHLPNRVALNDILKRTIVDAERTGMMFAVLFIDLDHFKLYNDSFGHAIGDRVLQIAASRLARAVRAQDTVARLGGDEFVVISRGMVNETNGRRVAAKLNEAIHEPLVMANAPEISLTASIGVALFPQDGGDAETLLHSADLAMYRAKQQGRNRFVEHHAGGEPMAHESLFRERRVRKGVDQNEFVAHYQPIVDLHTGRIRAMEALARWSHPSRGMLLPVQFIDLAERSGTIVTLGELMLRAACIEGARWVQLFGTDAPMVSVNVSPRQFRDDGFLSVVEGALSESGLSPGSLQLEVTESLLIEDEEQAIATLHVLAQSGISLAIDDFGTGYSSLGYLKKLPVSTLKIDKSLITNIATTPADVAIVRAILAMSHSLSLQVVAEGVEGYRPAHFLADEGCSAIQGFVIERAVAAAEAIDFIRTFDTQRFVSEVARG